MKLTVKNLQNKKLKEIEVPAEVFEYPFNEHLVHLAVEACRAAARSGSAKTKTRGEVSGSGKKPWRQKGTGRARVGSKRTPLWRTGGIVHGPQPRSSKKRVSAREKRNALKSALAQRVREDSLLILDSLDLKTHKTAELAKHLAKLGVQGKTLLVDRYENDNLALAARNMPQMKAVDALGVNVYDVVDRSQVVVSESALLRIVEMLSK
jgi:large subunit ribosomal protein L4